MENKGHLIILESNHNPFPANDFRRAKIAHHLHLFHVYSFNIDKTCDSVVIDERKTHLLIDSIFNNYTASDKTEVYFVSLLVELTIAYKAISKIVHDVIDAIRERSPANGIDTIQTSNVIEDASNNIDLIDPDITFSESKINSDVSEIKLNESTTSFNSSDTTNETSNQPKVIRFCLLEDVSFSSRAYVFQSKEKQFIRNFERLQDKYSVPFALSFSASTSSTVIQFTIDSLNHVVNIWGEGDVYITKISDILENSEYYWNELRNGIQYHEMFNQGNAVPRLVSIQSKRSKINQCLPLYRHPRDYEPPNEEIPVGCAVEKILHHVEDTIGISGLNHVFIQYYRDGSDNIAMHSDKTLDMDYDTPILNLSLGTTRYMYIQEKNNKNNIEKIPLVHGECVVFGLKTNQLWCHEVPKLIPMPSAHEIFGHSRISLTIRKINTFLTHDGYVIGQGSPFHTVEELQMGLPSLCTCHPTLSSEGVETPILVGCIVHGIHGTSYEMNRIELIKAFSKENRLSNDFNRTDVYGTGYLLR